MSTNMIVFALSNLISGVLELIPAKRLGSSSSNYGKPLEHNFLCLSEATDRYIPVKLDILRDLSSSRHLSAEVVVLPEEKQVVRQFQHITFPDRYFKAL